MAASSGVFNLLTNDWDADCLSRMDLPRSLLPDVVPSGSLLGPLTPQAAERTGLVAGIPVFGGIGDNQASFLGSVASRDDSVLVNVGTGGQVAMWSADFVHDRALETRPFPGGGFLLVAAGLSGGAAYATLDRELSRVRPELAAYVDDGVRVIVEAQGGFGVRDGLYQRDIAMQDVLQNVLGVAGGTNTEHLKLCALVFHLGAYLLEHLLGVFDRVAVGKLIRLAKNIPVIVYQCRLC